MERERMCIACRQMKDKKQLLRIVKSKEGEITVDLTGKKMEEVHMFVKALTA